MASSVTLVGLLTDLMRLELLLVCIIRDDDAEEKEKGVAVVVDWLGET